MPDFGKLRCETQAKLSLRVSQSRKCHEIEFERREAVLLPLNLNENRIVIDFIDGYQYRSGAHEALFKRMVRATSRQNLFWIHAYYFALKSLPFLEIARYLLSLRKLRSSEIYSILKLLGIDFKKEKKIIDFMRINSDRYESNIPMKESAVIFDEIYGPSEEFQLLRLYQEHHKMPSQILGTKHIPKRFIDEQFIKAHEYIQLMRQKNLRRVDLSWFNGLNHIPFSLYQMDRLEQLEISSRIGYLSPEIKALKYLRELKLRYVRFDQLPAEIFELKQLKKLTIENSHIKEFPEAIKNLTGLKVLNLKRNQMSQIPAPIFALKELEFLELKGNKIEHVSAQIGELKCLKYLSLFGNRIRNLPVQIVNLEQLRTLNLDQYQIGHISTELKQFLDERGIGCQSLGGMQVWF